MHAKLNKSSAGKKLIRVKSKGFTQAEFLMPSTSIKSRFKHTVTIHFFRRDLFEQML